MKILKYWPSLSRIRLSETNISDETVLRIPSTITMLDLANTRLSGNCASAFCNMPHLDTLNLSNSKLPGSQLKHLSCLSKMRELNISGLKTPKDFVQKVLLHMTLLYRLELRGTSISDSDCAHLKRLNHLDFLDLQGTLLTDKSIESLKQMQKLHSLNISYTNITESGYKQLCTALEKCKIAWIPIQ